MPAGANAVLSWDQGTQPLFPTQQLQSSPGITPPVWTDVTTATNVTGTVRSLAVPSSGPAKYFRLRSK